MTLIDDWKFLAPRLWSVRLAVLSALLSAAEFAIPVRGPRRAVGALRRRRRGGQPGRGGGALRRPAEARMSARYCCLCGSTSHSLSHCPWKKGLPP